jgi:hypothetical protein
VVGGRREKEDENVVAGRVLSNILHHMKIYSSIRRSYVTIYHWTTKQSVDVLEN